MIIPPSISLAHAQKKVKVDRKDKKILLELSRNAHMPLSRISRAVKLSRDAVAYRIEKLQNKGVIPYALTVIDVKALGYEPYHLFIKLGSCSQDKEEQALQKIAQLPFVRSVLKLYGSFDVEIAVIARNHEELAKDVEILLEASKGTIHQTEYLILSETLRIEVFPESFIKAGSAIKAPKKYPPAKLDALDFAILKEIRKNAFFTLVSLAKKVGLSVDAVNYRIKKMYGPVIKGYVPAINYASLNYKIFVILIELSQQEKSNAVSSFLKSHGEVIWAVKTIGRYQLLCYLCVSHDEEIHKFASLLRNSFVGIIKNVDTSLAYKEYQYTYAPDCLFG